MGGRVGGFGMSQRKRNLWTAPKGSSINYVVGRGDPHVRVRPSMVFKGKMHFRGSLQLLSQKSVVAFKHLSLRHWFDCLWEKKRKKNKKHCMLSFQQQKHRKPREVGRKKQLFVRAHSPILPDAVRKTNDKVTFFLLPYCLMSEDNKHFFLAHGTPQQSNFFLFSLARKRLKKRFKRQPFRAKLNPVAFKTKLFCMGRS